MTALGGDVTTRDVTLALYMLGSMCFLAGSVVAWVTR